MKSGGWKPPNVFMRVLSYPCTKYTTSDGSTCTQEVARSTYTLENLSRGFLTKRGGLKPPNVLRRVLSYPCTKYSTWNGSACIQEVARST
ncbi:hypothetical protein CDAR_374361 [Caerostris darwini]|uniref:Uncharacterized protein n=1 Tax=Caerostris darwini TaxID=1538125 RepID=A0AAV4SVC2_9ARAC|nr:hypothetical protein CDAR_374361 [Caerostris darwini]